MKTKIGINGFGRIGRNAFKIAFSRSDLEVVAVNDLTDTKTLAYLLKHDSNYGTFQNEVGFDEENIIVDGQKIKVLAEKDPTALPWKDLGVEVVIESTGRFTKKEDAEKHIIGGGARKVIISGPSKSDGVDTIVIGANEDKLGNFRPEFRGREIPANHCAQLYCEPNVARRTGQRFARRPQCCRKHCSNHHRSGRRCDFDLTAT
jgi:glyceraldehyde-3-phosphate dehydrogenase type I